MFEVSIGDLIESAGERFAGGAPQDAATLLRQAAGMLAPDPALAALKKIAFLRPLGDVDACKSPRKIVEQMERIALAAIANSAGDA